jgi:type II secretory pathway component PulF
MHWVAMLLQENQPSPEQIQHFATAFAAIIPLLLLITIAIFMIPCWFILKKAGFTPWLSLLCLIPTFGLLVLLYVLAFADWKVVPVQQAGYPPQYPPPPQPPLPPRA